MPTLSRRTFLDPSWTIRHLITRYPLTRTCFGGWLDQDDPRVLDRSLADFLRQRFTDKPYDPVFRGFVTSALNNVLGSYYGAPLRGPADWLHPDDETAPADFWSDTPVPVPLSADRLGLEAEQGLPTAYGWASGGAWNVRYARATGGLDHLACWNWRGGHRGSQNLFTRGGLAFGDADTPHAFRQVTGWPFGFANRWGRNTATVCLDGRSLFLGLASARPWAALEWGARLRRDGIAWRQLGWDDAEQAFLVQVSQMHSRFCDSIRFHPAAQGLDLAALAAVHNFRPGFDAAENPDRLLSGQLFLLIGGDGGRPEHAADGRLTWRSRTSLQLRLAAGTTYAEAVAEWRRGRAGCPAALRRCRAAYRQVERSIPRLDCPGQPNLAATTAVAPLLLEALKLPGNDTMRYGPGTSGYIDTHTSLMAMRGVLFHGDSGFVARYLAFLADPARRGAQGQIATNHFYDRTIDSHMQDWVFNDVTWLALIGHLRWHRRSADRTLYAAGRQHLLRLLRDADPETGLFASRGYWPDHPQRDVGRKGSPWPVLESGVWYEALRNWEILAQEHREPALAARLGRVARKVRAAFVPLFFDPTVGLFCDNVDPATRARHPQFSLFGLHFLHGMFGHELLDLATARQAADAAWRGLHQPSWKLFRTCLPHGDYHSQFEYIYMHWMQGLGKLFRLAGHQEGLRAISDSYAFHLGKFRNFPESFNMKGGLSLEQHSAGGWFIETLGTRSQVIFEDLCGITLSPHTLAIQPTGWGEGRRRLRNLRIGKSCWDISYTGSGAHLASCRIDGRPWQGSCVLPGRWLREGKHAVHLACADRQPTHPVLLDATGLDLLDARVSGGGLSLRLQGPGRADLRLSCPDHPLIRIDGRSAACTWDAASRQAIVTVAARGRPEIAVEITAP
ncbi:MAG: hypothetical protein L6R48_07885 [Planctomycetes bacterium]|nr:hypothetical protein [Planctomycetota bacterium]